MAENMKVSLSTTDLNLISEIEYLDWAVENQELEGNAGGDHIISIDRDNYLLSNSKAKDLVNQYRSGYDVLDVKYTKISRFPLRAAIEEMGLDQLHESGLREIYNIQPHYFNVDGLNTILDSAGFTGSSLFKLGKYLNVLDSKGLKREAFMEDVSQLVRYDLLDSAAHYIQNNWGRDFTFPIAGSGRPLNEEDLKGGLKVIIDLARFADYLERNSKIPLERLKEIYPPLQVIDTIDDIVSGRVQVGLEPKALIKSTGAGYSSETNSICLKTLVNHSDYGIKRRQNADGSFTDIHVTPEESTRVHEMVHAWQDKLSIDKPLVHTEREAQAWNVQRLYDLYLKGESEFDKYTAALKKITESRGDKLIEFFNKISPLTGAEIFMKNFEVSTHGTASQIWAKEFANIIKAGVVPSTADIKKIEVKSTQGFANANLTKYLGLVHRNKSIFASIKAIKSMSPNKFIDLTYIDEKGVEEKKGVKIRSREGRKKWFDENKPKVEKALDYLDTLTLKGSDIQIKTNLMLYSMTLLVVIRAENLEAKPDKELISDLAKHFISLSYRQANQAARTPEKDRGI